MNKNCLSWMMILITTLLLAACGGGGSGSSTTNPNLTGITGGIAADPYIVGAVFEEIAADGVTVLQRASTASDSQGRFEFARPLTKGSTVRIKPSQRGNHGLTAYTGTVKAVVDQAGPRLLVTPLTTLVADGATPTEVVQLCRDAGITISAEQIDDDPMAPLLGANSISDADLALLQANMVINAVLEAQSTNPAPATLAVSIDTTLLKEMASAIKSMMNSSVITQVRQDLAQDPALSTPVQVEDILIAAAEQAKTLIDQARTRMQSGGIRNGDLSGQVPNLIANLPQTTKNVAMNNQGSGGGGTVLDGAALYASNCATCHSSLANTSKPGRTASQIQSAIDNNIGGMGSIASLTTAEIQAIADALATSTTGGGNNGGGGSTQPDGIALYNSECAGCHGNLANTSKPGRTASQIQSAIDNNIGGMGSLNTLTTTEVQAIADALPTGNTGGGGNSGGGTTTPDGPTLYANNCASCHGPLASTSKPGRTASQIQGAIDNNVGGMGFLNTLTTAEVQAIADALPAGNTGGGGGPDYSDCTACHAQPPNGNSFPNTAGAHAAHKTLPGVGADCSVCHTGHDHNGQVDLGFPAAFDAKSGVATANSNGTCSNIICHGGKTTPDWWSGSINVDRQCTSCHASGTSAYNSYNSGKHSKHISKGYACTDCHNTAKMSNHFGDLTTTGFETDPAGTVGGGNTRVGSYDGRNCSNIQCHGSKSW